MRECWSYAGNKNVPRDFQDLWATKWMSMVISLAKKDDSSVIQHYLKELENEDDQTNGKQKYRNLSYYLI